MSAKSPALFDVDWLLLSASRNMLKVMTREVARREPTAI
jgi:hypothetical protein